MCCLKKQSKRPLFIWTDFFIIYESALCINQIILSGRAEHLSPPSGRASNDITTDVCQRVSSPHLPRQQVCLSSPSIALFYLTFFYPITFLRRFFFELSSIASAILLSIRLDPLLAPFSSGSLTQNASRHRRQTAHLWWTSKHK